MGNAWTSEEIDWLKANYCGSTNEVLRKMFPNRTQLAIDKKAFKLGLRKPPEIKSKNYSAANKGEKAPHWKGGTRMTRKGYRQRMMPGHPRADSSGYVMEHILAWEEHTGVPVPRNCCIHHLNGDKQDNRIQNLCMMQHTAHTVFHHTGVKRKNKNNCE